MTAPQRYDTVHGDGDGHVEDVRARQCADEELQRLPLLLLGTDAEDAPSVGQDGHARADQPSQRVGVDDVILHGGYLIHHVGAGQGGRLEELLARAGAHEEKEEVVMGRRGCRASGKAGILSGWACTLHGLDAVGRERSGGVTQSDGGGGGGGGGWRTRASSFISQRLERGREKRGTRVIRDRGSEEDMRKIVLVSPIQNNP